MGKLTKMSGMGDETLVEWDAEDASSIKEAKKQFKKLQEKGYRAYRIATETVVKKGEEIRHFDPNAETILMAAPLAGG